MYQFIINHQYTLYSNCKIQLFHETAIRKLLIHEEFRIIVQSDNHIIHTSGLGMLRHFISAHIVDNAAIPSTFAPRP